MSPTARPIDGGSHAEPRDVARETSRKIPTRTRCTGERSITSRSIATLRRRLLTPSGFSGPASCKSRRRRSDRAKLPRPDFVRGNMNSDLDSTSRTPCTCWLLVRSGAAPMPTLAAGDVNGDSIRHRRRVVSVSVLVLGSAQRLCRTRRRVVSELPKLQHDTPRLRPMARTALSQPRHAKRDRRHRWSE